MKIKSESKLRIRQFLFSIFLCSVTVLSAQQGTVKGKVADSKGEPIIGANIQVEGTTVGTISDVNGEYTITKVPAGTVQLTVKYVGYLNETSMVTVIENQTTETSFVLVEDLQQLSEVVVIGYGTVKKSDLVGAVASVTVDDLQKIPNTGVSSMLQGLAAGVIVSQNSGQPGSESRIQIRGLATVNGGTPLVVIDGISGGSLNDVNPSDIESMEILKDAASQSIYGAAGGNGVILITTKKGKEGKIQVKFDMYEGFSKPWKTDINMADGQEYAGLLNQYRASIGGLQAFPQDANTGLYLDPADSTVLKNTNWTDEIFRKTARSRNYNLAFSGGNKMAKFYAGFNYLNEEGTVLKTSNKKYTARLNSDLTLFKIFTIGENFNISQGNLKQQDERSEYSSPLATSIQMLPLVPIYAVDGSGNYAYRAAGQSAGIKNPLAQIDVNNNNFKETTVDFNGFIRIKVMKGLTFESNYGIRYNPQEYRRFVPKHDIGDSAAKNPSQGLSNYQLDYNEQKFNSWLWQNFINYNFTVLDKHNFAVTLGTESGYTKNDFTNRQGFLPTIDFAPSDWMDYSETDSLDVLQQRMTETKKYAYFARLNYDFAGIFLLQGNFRRDYSSVFGPNKRVGNFPSLSIGLKFSEFDFIKNMNIIDFGKIRLGYGETGNSSIQPFLYLSTIGPAPIDNYPFGGIVQEGASVKTAGNPDLSWETVVTKNIGLDLRLLRNRVSFSIDFFARQNKDMLLRKSVPYYVGYYVGDPGNELGDPNLDTRPLVNYGTLDNKGFEISLSYKDQVGKLKYDINANFTRAITKIKDIGDALYGGTGRGFSQVCQTRNGGPVSAFYGYKTDGIYQQDEYGWFKNTNNKWTRVPINENGATIVTGTDAAGNAVSYTTMDESAQVGDLKFIDSDANGSIGASDWVQIGDPNPDFTYGFGANFEYSNFDLSLFFQGSYGNDIFNMLKVNSYTARNGGLNMSSDMKDSYFPAQFDITNRNIDPVEKEPARNVNTGRQRMDGDMASSDFYVEDGSYLRLKNLQLGYTFPVTSTQKFKAQKLRIYVSARNLLTFTKYTGFDPEVGENTNNSNSLLERGFDRGTYPQSKMYTIGLSLLF